MENLKIVAVALFGTVALAIGVYFVITHFKEKKENEIIPHAYGDTTMFLRRNQIESFEALGRAQKRSMVNSFKAKVKRGQYKAIYKKGALVGYVEN